MIEGTIDRAALQARGFTGFVPLRTLQARLMAWAPDVPGVYVMLREDGSPPVFLEQSPAGRYRGDPTVTIDRLWAEWVPGAVVLYIGEGASIRRRLDLYIRYGRGEAVRHHGGRLIWQLADSQDLVFAWKQCENKSAARQLESALIGEFEALHGRMPFANLRH